MGSCSLGHFCGIQLLGVLRLLWLLVWMLLWMWMWVWMWFLLCVPLLDHFRWYYGERVISEKVVGVQGVFLGLRDLLVGVHLRPLL